MNNCGKESQDYVLFCGVWVHKDTRTAAFIRSGELQKARRLLDYCYEASIAKYEYAAVAQLRHRYKDAV